MTSHPTFGSMRGSPVIERPAAYALLHGAEGVAVVCADRLFLPGGGIEDGESAEDAVVRELREECRIDAVCTERFAEAVQFFSTERDGRHYRSHMVFIECRAVGKLDGRGEHETRWLSAVPQREEFAHGAHFWAFEQYSTALTRRNAAGGGPTDDNRDR